MNDYYTAQLRAQQVSEETGLSLRQIAELPLNEWSRLTHGETPAQAAMRALDAEVPGIPLQEPVPVPDQPVEPSGQSDVSKLSMGEYARLRGQLGMGRPTSAYGIFGN